MHIGRFIREGFEKHATGDLERAAQVENRDEWRIIKIKIKRSERVEHFQERLLYLRF